MQTKTITVGDQKYLVKVGRIKGKVKCLSMVDDESYGQVFDYDGRFDKMSDKKLEESGLMDETYEVISVSSVEAKIPAVNFIGTILVNVDNTKLSDADFRQMIRNTLPVVEKPLLDKIASEKKQKEVEKYYKEE